MVDREHQKPLPLEERVRQDSRFAELCSDFADWIPRLVGLIEASQNPNNSHSAFWISYTTLINLHLESIRLDRPDFSWHDIEADTTFYKKIFDVMDLTASNGFFETRNEDGTFAYGPLDTDFYTVETIADASHFLIELPGWIKDDSAELPLPNPVV